MNFWLWILVGVFALGLMVLMHEFGHFLLAKLLGVRVEIFSIGFGPRLFGRRRGDTDYRLSALPLGGYVKMAGDTPGELTGEPHEFLSKPRWQRSLIVLAGPLTNILMAIFFLTGLYAYNYERDAYLDEPAVIGVVLPDTPAQRAGLQVGDRIARFGRLQSPTWEEVLLETGLGRGDSVSLEVERGGATVALELALTQQEREGGGVGWLPELRPMVQSVSRGMPAEKAGLRRGDLLLALNGEPVRIDPQRPNFFSDRLQQAGGKPAVVTIKRENQTFDVTITPVFGDHPEGRRWVLGLSLGAPRVQKDLTLGQAFQMSLRANAALSGRMLVLVGRLLTGGASLRGLQGPVGIVALSGEVGEQGGTPQIVNLMAAISLSLGILNLLPFPILDGGHLLFFTIEGALRRDVSLRIKEITYNVAFVLLIALAAVVMYNDIARILRN